VVIDSIDLTGDDDVGVSLVRQSQIVVASPHAVARRGLPDAATAAAAAFPALADGGVPSGRDVDITRGQPPVDASAIDALGVGDTSAAETLAATCAAKPAAAAEPEQDGSPPRTAALSTLQLATVTPAAGSLARLEEEEVVVVEEEQSLTSAETALGTAGAPPSVIQTGSKRKRRQKLAENAEKGEPRKRRSQTFGTQSACELALEDAVLLTNEDGDARQVRMRLAASVRCLSLYWGIHILHD
jgi:hypothetical protein